jgi:hypothetical protein
MASKYSEEMRAALSKRRGSIKLDGSAEEKQKFLSRQGDEEAGAKSDADKDAAYERVEKETEAAETVNAAGLPYRKADKVLGSFKKGGKVKKTGVYKLHKNEVVVPAKKVAKMPNMSALYGK